MSDFEVKLNLGEPIVGFMVKYSGGALNTWLTVPELIKVRDEANEIITEAYKKGYVADE